MGRLGRQKITTTGGGTELEAELGGVRVVVVRWRQAGDGAAVVKARECCLWDLSEAGGAWTVRRIGGGGL